MKSVFITDTPKGCLSCKLRRVIYKDNIGYQLCSLDIEHGYLSEHCFKCTDLKKGWKSDKCPLRPMK